MVTHFIALLSRIAFTSPGSSFIHLIRTSAPHMSGAYSRSEALWPALVSMICQRFENMASARKRKATALGLASILRASTAEPERNVILASVPEMIAVWSEAIAEIRESRPAKYVRPTSPIASMELDAFFDDDEGADGWLEDLSPGSGRAQHVAMASEATSLPAYVSEVLNLAQSPELAAVLGSLDPLVLDMFRSDLASQ